MSDIRSRMEPLSPPGDLGTYSASAEAALTSIAISLKRIADSLDDPGGWSGRSQPIRVIREPNA